MYYIIETQEQLSKFSKYNLQNSYVQPILTNDKYHYVLSDVVAYYIKPIQSKLGFILPVNHHESLNLPQDTVFNFLQDHVNVAYVYDEKHSIHHLPEFNTVRSFKLVQWLKDGKVLNIDNYNTPIHNHLYALHGDRLDLNRTVPLPKLCEKYDNFVQDNNRLFNSKVYEEDYYQFYSAMNKVFYELESYGIPVNKKTLTKYFTIDSPQSCIKSGYFYSEYNLFTQTGRPSNAFGGVNFGALPKGDESRSFIESKFTKLIEFDYKSYHPNILSNMVEYQFDSDDIHTHLGKLYYKTDNLTEEQYNDSKKLTFKHLYTNQKDNIDLEYFNLVDNLKNKLWRCYKDKGYIASELSAKPVKGIESITQLLPYILQNYETERNAVVIAKVINYLRDKQTVLVLYNYDSFLIDWSKEDGHEVLTDIQAILEKGGYKTSCSYGKNYASMKKM